MDRQNRCAVARIAGRVWDVENSVFKRFRRWVKADAFYRMFKALSADTDFEDVMVDGSIVKVHRSGQGAEGGLSARP